MIKLWDIVIQLTSPIIICFSAYPVVQRFFLKSKEYKSGEKLIASFIIGLMILMLLPYSVGIILGTGFRKTAWLIYFISVFSLVLNIKIWIKGIKTLLNKTRNYFFRRDLFNIAFLVSIMGFSIKYTYYLLIRAVTDWDAVSFYLPYAKAIFFTDSIPLTAFDFSRITKPMGISFLYAWIYSLCSTTLAESFRLIPLAFTFITMLLIYLIAKNFSSILVAKLTVMIYMILPLHDSILYYCAYYPDVAFTSLILAVFYFLYRYTQTLETKYCLIGGLALGLSMLLKAQTALFLVSIILVFLPISRIKLLRIAASFTVPFGFLFFLFFSSAVFPPPSSLFTIDGLIVFVLVALLSSLIALIVEAQHKTMGDKDLGFRPLTGLFIFGGASSIMLVWYLRNYLTFGSFIWLSLIKQPNLQWAIHIISGFTPQMPQVSETFLLMLILVLFVHPILGSVWIIPKLVGMAKLRGKKEMLPVHSLVLGFFLSYILYAFFSVIVVSSFTVNPRDFLPLAPFFSIYSAWGLLTIAEYVWKDRARQITLCLLAFLGFVSLIQSLLLLYYPPSFLAGILSQIAKLSLSSWELLAHGPPEAALNWLAFGLITGLFSLLPLIGKRCIDYISHKKKKRIVIHFFPKSSAAHKKALTCVLISIVVLSVQIAPYGGLTYEFGNGNILDFKENQERMLFDGLYTDILTYLKDNVRSGDVVLTVGAGFTGLQYKLDSVRLIDITFPDNLARMRELLESNKTEEILTMLYNLNVRYFLLPKWGTRDTSFMEWLLNDTRLLYVIWNPGISAIRITSGGWILFELLNTKEDMLVGLKIPLWSIDFPKSIQ